MMSHSLKPELETFLRHVVATGQYRSTEEALNAAVELLKRRDEAESKLESLLQEAVDSGPATEMTTEDWASIENEGLKRIRSRQSA